MTLGAALSTWWLVSPLNAQTTTEPKESQTWGLRGLRGGYCVHFLVEPRDAADELKEGFLLVRADRDQSLHPSLQHVIRSQPEFASWAPSNVCFYFLDAVDVGSRRIADKNGRRYQMLGVWTLATVEQGSGKPRRLVLDMYANEGSLIRAADNAKVRLHEAHSVVSDKADTTTDIYSVKLGKTLLVWRGRPAGDSTRVEQPIEQSWSQIVGPRGSIWSAQLSIKPAWSRALVGSLTVEGKGDLSKWLKASPIRFVGPFFRGGGGDLRLTK